MKFVLSMPSDGQSNNYIINALQDSGHDIFFCDHRRFMKEALESMPTILKNERPDIFLALYLVPGQTYPADYIRMLKSRFPNVKYCSWIFDATINGLYCDENKDFIDIVKEYDYFFTVCKGQVESFRKRGVNAFYLREGVDRYVYDLTGIFKKYDVTFIGQLGHPNVHKERLSLMKRIISSHDNTKIYGPLFTDDTEIMNYHAKRPTFNDIEHSRIIAETKINIGHSGWPHIEGYFSARNYRIMGSGGFLMANHSLNIEEVFEPDKEIVLYENENDCLEKIKFYLRNDSLRDEISQRGKIKVLNEHTFSNRIKEMEDIIR